MAKALPTRERVKPADKWNIEALYADDAAWETDFARAEVWPARMQSFQGRLAESAETLAEALRTWFDANRHMENLYVYAHLRNDEDLGNSHYQTMYDRARSAFIRLSTAGSYLSPEILKIDDATVQRWMDTEALSPYRVWLEDLLRGKPYTLSEPEERLMAMVSEPLGAIHQVFSVLKNVDLAARLPKVADENGEDEQLTHASFIRLLESRDRSVRAAAFENYYKEYRGNRNTIAATLDGAVKAHVFEARARNFPSALDAALFGDNVDASVYNALISAVHDALPAFYRYVALRRRLLGVEQLHMYDVYVPVVPAVDMHFEYDEAVELVTRAMQPLGGEYVETMGQGLLNGWVDRYENAGKRSGAYSSGSYDSMPYILMNYTGTLDAVSTLAHELGHSMHSWYSNHAQPYHLADYRILVAEVASTTNEYFMTQYLLEITDDRATRAYLIDRYLDSFRATIFRQTMFAEFEKLIHERVEAGEPLTAEALDATYYELVKLYFGDTVAFDAEDEPIAYEWARVDHFFYDFYVYKYATGMASALALAAAILAEGQPAVERYFAFLKGGSSQYPLDQLRSAGVDLTTPVPVASALAEFERLTTEFEQLMS